MSSINDTRVLISFGAVEGGFEFAMQLRHDIMTKFGKKDPNDKFFAYIDALSLRDENGTEYPWNELFGIYKMCNEKWDAFYKEAMNNCKYMVFLISEPWLKSKWCWQEFEWYQKIITTKSITPIFVIFKDAQSILDYSNNIKDSTGAVHSLKDLWQRMIAGQGVDTICINSVREDIVGVATINNKTYRYTYKYTCSIEERNNILSKIKNLN